MVSLQAVANKSFLSLVVLLSLAINAYGACPEGKESNAKKEDEKLLQEVQLPVDPSRSTNAQTNEQYVQCFVIRTKQGKNFIGAYWYHQGNPGDTAVDIFSVEGSISRLAAQRVYSGEVDARAVALEVVDFDKDGNDDLLFITDTGGMIAKTGVIALRQTAAGFSEVFSTAGTEVWIYRERGQVRIIVKAKSAKQIDEYSWSPPKRTFDVTRTTELIY